MPPSSASASNSSVVGRRSCGTTGSVGGGHGRGTSGESLGESLFLLKFPLFFIWFPSFQLSPLADMFISFPRKTKCTDAIMLNTSGSSLTAAARVGRAPPPHMTPSAASSSAQQQQQQQQQQPWSPPSDSSSLRTAALTAAAARAAAGATGASNSFGGFVVANAAAGGVSSPHTGVSSPTTSALPSFSSPAAPPPNSNNNPSPLATLEAALAYRLAEYAENRSLTAVVPVENPGLAAAEPELFDLSPDQAEATQLKLAELARAVRACSAHRARAEAGVDLCCGLCTLTGNGARVPQYCRAWEL